MIVCIDYGAGNVQSIGNGFKKIGVETILSSNPKDFKDADALVLPGVGNFGSAMEKLFPMKPAILEFVDSGKPFLGVCLGIQVIFESSAEAPGVAGLGLLKGSCEKFDSTKMKVPQMGWNTLKIAKENPLLEGISEGDFFYFVHSYYPKPKNKDVVVAETEYGLEFPAVVVKDNVFATQFHPEKSAEKGLRILENFVGIVKK
ncbi:MAG TPA: imidazole glycerol phosphate synthase subunit HisH [Candidatus Altiarchaeales archaeon]|nr:imidazole glycerol phosphate synthase subunit HisH [Candidatus Altiarchaeales archaeon]